ncbi:hypothetical protein [Clostridium sp. HBUAS56017]|nr:hypothetical protein [Clostridium sp. HBUAS56017]
MPYEKDGSLNVLVGQGSDGDYNGGLRLYMNLKIMGRHGAI